MKLSLFFGKIKLADLVIAIVILSASFAAILFALDPWQAARKKHDSQFGPTARRLQSTITEHFTKLGQIPTESFGFSPANEALKTLGVFDQFSGDKFIIEESGNFYVGKEKGSTASYYVCYVPESKFLRDSRCSDSFVYTLNSDGTRSPVKCDINSTWQLGNNPWVICSPN